MSTIERLKVVIAKLEVIQEMGVDMTEIQRKEISQELIDIVLARDIQQQRERDLIEKLGELL